MTEAFQEYLRYMRMPKQTQIATPEMLRKTISAIIQPEKRCTNMIYIALEYNIY